MGKLAALTAMAGAEWCPSTSAWARVRTVWVHDRVPPNLVTLRGQPSRATRRRQALAGMGGTGSDSNPSLPAKLKKALTHPRFPGHQSVEIPTFFGACEFAWAPHSRANSAGVFHASAVWGLSSL